MTAERRTKSPRDEKGPLTWLHQRRDKNGQPLISRQEREAGERLAADFHASMLNPRLTASWAGTTSSRKQRRGASGFGMEIRDRAISAKQRFQKA
jgi:hypothetical protein